MNKQISSETIAEGIDKSLVGLTIKSILIIAGILSALIILAFIGNLIYNHFNPQEQTAMVDTHCGNLENLYCKVSIGNSSINDYITSFSVCGYQEANAFYEQIKPSIEEDVKNNNLKFNLNFKIKYLECQ